MPSFDAPPTPLTPPQRRLLWALAALVAVTRWFAMASSPWDWDEVQFMAGVREYDVGQHHPHPAGFPLYILAGKIVRLLGLSDFRSLQVVTLVAACALFPVAFFLARELRLPVRTSMLAALLFVFFPNIWYFGGTVFSDIAATAAALAAVWMLLRGCRDGRSFLAGCALIGAALGMRPHSGFILLPPLLLATWHQRAAWRRIFAGAAITAGIVIASYAGAALASESVAVFVERVRFFQQWVYEVDSIANPGRTPLRPLAWDFFGWPMGPGRTSLALAAVSGLGAAIGLIRRHWGIVATLATFGPYMIFSWLMHDPVGFRRYSTAYVVIYALLAAYALEQLTARFDRAAFVHAALAMAFVGRYLWWTGPALIEVRSTVAPTHAAASYAQRVVPRGSRVWVDDSMGPWGSYYLADRKVIRVTSPGELPVAGVTAHDYFLTEGAMQEPGARVFERSQDRIGDIHPRRHFIASVSPVSIIWRFGEGWSDPESHRDEHWRWMAGRSVVLVPSRGTRARLMLELAPPNEVQPEVEVRVNGASLERFPLRGRVRKEWVIEGAAGWNRLELACSPTINPLKSGTGSDDRELGLRLLAYEWKPLP